MWLVTCALVRELCGEGVSFFPMWTGRVPAATFASGDRISSLVDDRVVLIALADDVTLEGAPPQSVDHTGGEFQ